MSRARGVPTEHALLALAAIASTACSDGEAWTYSGRDSGACEPAEAVGQIPAILTEASGVTRDPRSPNLFWAHNDSGNPAELIAIDGRGRVLGVVPLRGASNRDLEDVATGPCPSGSCIYLGDIGDNLAIHGAVVIHRFPLPPLPDSAEAGEDSAERTVSTGTNGRVALPPVRAESSRRFVYPDGPRDAEALAVDGARGELLVITKGREDVVELYAATLDDDAGRVGEATAPDTLRRVGRLNLPIGDGTGQLVTGADLSPAGDRLAVRSYTTLYQFSWPGSKQFDTLSAPAHSPLLGALEAQGEGVAWAADGETLMLVSEERRGRGPSLSRVRCPTSAHDDHPRPAPRG